MPVGSARHPEYAPLAVLDAQTPKAWEAYRAEMYGRSAKPTCPECGGLRWLRADVPRGEPLFGQLVPCGTCAGDTRKQWITTNCGMQGDELNSRMHDWRLGTWEDEAKRHQREQARDAIEEAVGERRGFVTFWGDFGAGKTFALQIIVNEMRVKEVECFYAPLALLLDHLRSLYRTGTQSSRYWQRLMDVPALAVDEVTRYYETPWAQERLWMLADTRYRRMGSHLTIFATNDDPRVALPTSEPVGYLYSRQRQGRLVELRGDVRPAMVRRE